jgi:hypothetical protein
MMMTMSLVEHPNSSADVKYAVYVTSNMLQTPRKQPNNAGNMIGHGHPKYFTQLLSAYPWPHRLISSHQIHSLPTASLSGLVEESYTLPDISDTVSIQIGMRYAGGPTST